MLKSLDNKMAAGNMRELAEAEVDYGIKYDRHSMFLDGRLKTMLSPMDNYFHRTEHRLQATIEKH